MKWQVLAENPRDILETLLKNRGVEKKQAFLNPPLPKSEVKIPQKVITRIKKAIKNEEKIVVYGDYDVDGICATAIVWETLYALEAKVLPFIPQRENEGYGLSIAGIDNIDKETKLIFTVDSGIVANKAVDYAKKQGAEVIILDHHEKPSAQGGLPKAYAIIHTDKLCAAGIAYFFAQALTPKTLSLEPTLELAAIATVSDMMPLTGVNRSIVKHGLKTLSATKRPGLKALFEVAGIKTVGVYEIGYMIGPRINASGRIESALSALRLLCTHDQRKAMDLARKLNETNKERQVMVEESVGHALKNTVVTEKIIVIYDESYHPGVIGLIAGKMTEKYYLPSIVISKKDDISKASARSIAGFNIIEAIRTCEELLVNAGGHPMAAGFTIKTSEIANFKLQIESFAKEKITPELLERTLKVDCEISLDKVNYDLFSLLSALEPYGIGNPQPVFCSEAEVLNIRTMGAIGQHLKLVIASPISHRTKQSFEAVMFNASQWAAKLKAGDRIKIAYSLDLNSYNGKTTLQLKIKDISL